MQPFQRLARMFKNPKDAAKMFSVGNTQEGLAIDLYGYVGDWWDANEAQDLLNILNRNRNATDIILNVHSYGGYVTEGLAIMNQLKQHKAKVTGVVQGTAASMASVILMGADVVKVHESSWIMIHEVETEASGRADDLDKASEFTRALNLQAAEIYQAKTGLPLEQIQEMMKAETWMNGQQALDLGFADELIPLETALKTASPQMKAFAEKPLLFSALDVYNNIPLNCLSKDATAKLMAKVAAAKPEETNLNLTETTTVTNTVKATPEQIAAAQNIVNLHQSQPTAAELEAALKTVATAAAPAAQPAPVTAPTTVASTEVAEAIPAQQTAAQLAAEIAELCTLAGKPDKIAAFLSSGKTLDVIRAELLASRSAELNAIPAVTHQVSEIQGATTQSMADVAKETCAKMGLKPRL